MQTQTITKFDVLLSKPEEKLLKSCLSKDKARLALHHYFVSDGLLCATDGRRMAYIDLSKRSLREIPPDGFYRLVNGYGNGLAVFISASDFEGQSVPSARQAIPEKLKYHADISSQSKKNFRDGQSLSYAIAEILLMTNRLINSDFIKDIPYEEFGLYTGEGKEKDQGHPLVLEMSGTRSNINLLLLGLRFDLIKEYKPI